MLLGGGKGELCLYSTGGGNSLLKKNKKKEGESRPGETRLGKGVEKKAPTSWLSGKGSKTRRFEEGRNQAFKN